jgi:hypothetical protein
VILAEDVSARGLAADAVAVRVEVVFVVADHADTAGEGGPVPAAAGAVVVRDGGVEAGSCGSASRV